jgi:hypothetical protein
VTQIGGENRYFVLNSLWTIGEWLDAAVGGPALQRGRTHPGALRPGDKLDSWDVLIADPGECLALGFNLKAPGRGVLEFLIEPRSRERVRLTARAHWEPNGLAGILYWLTMQPAHLILFDRLTSEICRRAEGPETEVPVPAASAAWHERSAADPTDLAN